MLCVFCSRCLSKRLLKEFTVPANSVGWQAVPIVYNSVSNFFNFLYEPVPKGARRGPSIFWS